MNIASVGQTLTAVGAKGISGDNLPSPLNKTLEKILNVITLGIYGVYKKSLALEARNSILDLAKALIEWNPKTPDIPVKLKIAERNYELSDMPEGGIRLLDAATKEEMKVDGVSLGAIQNMILSDLMNHPDFSQDMERRIYEDSTVHVDFVGLKQQRANACGDASRNMILAYHGVDYAPATNSRDLFDGSAKDELLSELRGKGLSCVPLFGEVRDSYTCEEIQKSLKKDGPLLCELKGHFVIVHGANETFDRVDIFCPLLGNRCASLADFNAHLDWEQNFGAAPLMGFQKAGSHSSNVASGLGKNTDADFSPGIIDRMGVGVLATVYAIGNSWLKSPEAFANAS